MTSKSAMDTRHFMVEALWWCCSNVEKGIINGSQCNSMSVTAISESVESQSLLILFCVKQKWRCADLAWLQ